MKRAEEVANELFPRCIDEPDSFTESVGRQAAIDGYEQAEKDLTRWNSPNDHPKRGTDVLVKQNAYPGIRYIVGYWSGVCFYNSFNDRKIINVIGWREIL